MVRGWIKANGGDKDRLDDDAAEDLGAFLKQYGQRNV